MLKTEGRNWIADFKVKLILLYGLQILCISLAVASLFTVFANYLKVNPILSFTIVFLIALLVGFVIKRIFQINNTTTAKYLDEHFPQVEDSASLLLKSSSELSLLEQLQVNKIVDFFPLQQGFKKPTNKLLWSVLVLAFSIGVAFTVSHYALIPNYKSGEIPEAKPATLVKENIPAEIESVNIKIAPPSYTGRTVRSQSQFTIKAETGAKITWLITSNVALKKLNIIFNNTEVVALKAINNEFTQWSFSKTIDHAGFYQLEFDGKKSDLYQIEVIPDLPVDIKILAPKIHTTIDFGQIPRVNLSVSLTDDYGIKDAYISATLASGKGEGVSFTEKKLLFNLPLSGKKSIKLNKLIDLTALGMKPGDELYFYILAIDNNGQTSRSDVYLVSIADTAELMSMAGLANGIDLVPEYFRSQRQIIIDTEKLIKEEKTMSAEDFKSKSNNLGLDQKLLRLRYGKFLGEVAETEVGGEHHDDDHDDGGGAGVEFGNVQALMDEYAHKHDIAEDATFFEPELKAQLKAVLNEMWSSELRLRTYKLQEALPFEYKALRLLKELQQKSRAYVAKTTLKAVKLKLDKRLSGELDKIIEPTNNADFEIKDKTTEELKLLLTVLDQRKSGKAFQYGERELLRSGEAQLISAAATQPTSFLTALKSLRKLTTANKVVINDIEIVQKALKVLIGTEETLPQKQDASPAVKLSNGYFNYLKNGRE
jgi:hypothetical protein